VHEQTHWTVKGCSCDRIKANYLKIAVCVVCSVWKGDWQKLTVSFCGV